MPMKDPDSSIPELIKRIRHSFRQCEFDEVQNTLMDGEKCMKVEIQNLVRERDSLKNELDSLQRTQGFTELEKCSAEEKLGRSERRCKELDKLIVQMRNEIEKLTSEKSDLEEKMVRGSSESKEKDESLVKMKKEIGKLRSEKLDLEEKMVRSSSESKEKDESLTTMKKEIGRLRSEKLDLEEKVVWSSRKSKEKDESLVKMEKEIEELRLENVSANKSIEELKAKEIKADCVVEELKRKNVEAVQTIDELRAKMEDLSSLANGTHNFAAAATDAEVEENCNHFIMSSEVPASSGAANLAHLGRKEDDANMVRNSTPASGSAAESNAIVQDNEGQEVQGLHARAMQSGGEVAAKKTTTSSSAAGDVVITVSDSDDDDQNKRGRRRESNRKRKRSRGTTTTPSSRVKERGGSAFHNVEYVDLEDGPS